MRARTAVLGSAGAAVGVTALACGSYAAVSWARYGQVTGRDRPVDELLDRLMPNPDVDEYREVEVDASAPVAFAVARNMDLMQSPAIKAIFWLRGIPAMLRRERPASREPRGLVDEALAMGWSVLAEDIGLRIVLGAYTKPWQRKVTFHSLPADRFAAFQEPGYAKIIVTLEARPMGTKHCVLATRTRVVTTDAEARRRFRLYWAPMSAGIMLIRYLALASVKRQVEGARTP